MQKQILINCLSRHGISVVKIPIKRFANAHKFKTDSANNMQRAKPPHNPR
jgi:hypothetical protein